MRPGLGRCAIAAHDLNEGDTILTERAELFWVHGPDELVSLLKSYSEASENSRMRIDALTSEIQTHSSGLDDLLSTWQTVLERITHENAIFHDSNEYDLLKIVIRAHFNAHEVQKPSGAALFPTGAMINHSCNPNSFYRCEGHEIHFTAARKISKGSEIIASYLDSITMLKPTHLRQEALLLSKGFICACERCSADGRDSTRGVHCQSSVCDGVAYPDNLPLDCEGRSGETTFICESCGQGISGSLASEVVANEGKFYLDWLSRDNAMSRGESVVSKDSVMSIRKIEEYLHQTHYLAQLERILLIEGDSSTGQNHIQLIAHRFVLANWLFSSYATTVPYNLLGAMTGALGTLFDRQCHTIEPGVDVDRVLLIIKAVLPLARLRYGHLTAYPRALSLVLDKYSECSSLICHNRGRLARCGRCNSASYCSKSCQILHVKTQGHKAACAKVVAYSKQMKEIIQTCRW